VATDRGGDAEPLRLMAVHAHPDDESSKGAATMARYVAEGAQVLVCTLTGGERGDILNETLKKEQPELAAEIEADITAVRRAEMAKARDVLGVRHQWMGFVDSGFPDQEKGEPLPEGCFALEPLESAAAPLVRAVREFRPHVILTYDENGGYPHPDHIKCHEVSVEAFEAAGDPDRYPDAGEPWQPLKLYYHLTFHKARLESMHNVMVDHGLESPFGDWLARWEDRPFADKWPITTRIPCGDHFEVRDQALKAHVTQIDPNGMWFACPLHLQREAWPTEDYHLARSLVGGGDPAAAGGSAAESEVESDLFAGIRERAALPRG
jgi:mycothiol S-conjugate amidase